MRIPRFRSLPLLAALALAACPGGSEADRPTGGTDPAEGAVEIESALPALRVPGISPDDVEGKLLVCEWMNELRCPGDETAAPDGRPAHVLAAHPKATAWYALVDGFVHAVESGRPRLFVAGRRPDGGVGLLPLVDDPRVERDLRPGSLTGRPFGWSYGPGVFEVRLTREGARVRVRWGHVGARPRFELGNEWIHENRFVAAGEGPRPILPALAESLKESRETEGREWTALLVQVGEDVRWGELVRVLECAAAIPGIVIQPIWSRPDIQLVTVPQPDDADEPALGWNPPGKPEYVLVLAEGPEGLDAGRLFRRGQRYAAPDEVPIEEGRDTLVLRADREADWDLCAGMIARARADGKRVVLTFSSEDPNFQDERVLLLPPGLSGDEEPVEFALAAPEDDPSPEGRDVRLAVPEGAKAGPVLRRVLNLVRRGATAIDFVEGR